MASPLEKEFLSLLGLLMGGDRAQDDGQSEPQTQGCSLEGDRWAGNTVNVLG